LKLISKQFWRRGAPKLGERHWVLDRAITSPFYIIVRFRERQLANLVDRIQDWQLRFDVTPFKLASARMDAAVFVGKYPSGAVRGLSVSCRRSNTNWFIDLLDPLAILDPDDENVGTLSSARVLVIGLHAGD
jgi:hypothetical protein